MPYVRLLSTVVRKFLGICSSLPTADQSHGEFQVNDSPEKRTEERL